MDDTPSTVPPGGDPPRRPNTRANALSAPSYTRLIAVDTRVLPALLDSLEDAGVAAYGSPSTGERGGYLETRLPATPTEQLFVDASQRETAQLVVAAELPGLLAELQPAQADDERFAQIVAGFNAMPEMPVVPWPVSEDVDAGQPAPDDEPVAPWRPADPPEEHFVPPPPPPLPRPHPVTAWAWLAIVGGALLLFYYGATGREMTLTMLLLVVGSVAGGIGTLVYRMRDAPPTDSGPDDGAVV